MTRPRNHKHAEMIRRWLDDDSLEVEMISAAGEWVSALPSWDEGVVYRFKPKMIKCGDLEFPEPMRVAPDVDARCWLVNFYFAAPFLWTGHSSDFGWLKFGFLHTTQAAAEQHARALIALTESKS